MPLTHAPIIITPTDPRSPEAAALIALLSAELAGRYDYAEDGSGHFKPEDVLVPRAVFVVGRVNGEPVACGALRPMDEPHVAEVKRMFVAPAVRGRRYSRAVLMDLERRAAAMGYTVLRLETGNRQPEAIALYERSGYARIPNFGHYHGVAESLCFEKRIV